MTTEAPILEQAAEDVKAKAAYIHAETGYLPLEWDPATRRKGNIDRDVKASDGSVIEQIRYRAIVPGSSWNMQLNLSDPADVEFLELVKDWIENSGDPRVVSKKVSIIMGGNAEPDPFDRYESRKPENVVALMEASMLDDEAANREMLLRVARYELQREAGPRPLIMQFIDDAQRATGDESDDVEVVDE